MKKLAIILLFIGVLASKMEAQWTQMSNGIGNDHTVFSIATTGGKIYAGVAFANGAMGDGVYRSIDNGATWNILPLAPGNNGIETYCVATSGSTIYIGTDYFIWKSTNYGNTWTLLPGWSNAINYIAIKGSTIYGAAGHFLYVSYDNGNNWVQRSSPNDSTYFTSIAVHGNYLYASTNNDGTSGSVLRSVDDGQTWATLFTVSDMLNNTIYNQVQSLAFNGNIIYAGTVVSGVYISPDLGTTWHQSGLTTSNGGLKSIVLNGNDVIAGKANGVYLSKDAGNTWVEVNDGFTPFPADANALCVANGYVFLGSVFSTIWRCSLASLYTMDIAEATADGGFQIFPNPASDKIIVESNEKRGKAIQLSFYNITGKCVKWVSLQPYQQEVAIDELSNGVYLVEIQLNENLVRKKIVIQR